MGIYSSTETSDPYNEKPIEKKEKEEVKQDATEVTHRKKRNRKRRYYANNLNFY